MRELIIISYNPATRYTKHYVVEPSGNNRDGTLIGSMYVAGRVLRECESHSDAERYVVDHRNLRS